jgi:hypothetical protein
MNEMTMRERMLAVLSGGKIDRVPFITYDNVAAPNAEIWSALGRNNMGLIRWCKVHQFIHPNCRFQSRPISKDGLKGIQTVMSTPLGHLVQEKFFDPTFGSTSVSKHYIESPDDYLIFREYLKDIIVVEDDETFIRDWYDLGDDGLPMVYVERTPYQQLWIQWTSLLDLSLHFMDIPEMMEECTELLADIQRRVFQIIYKALDRLPISFVNIPDNITAPTIGDKNFRKYSLPLYKELVGILEGRGIPVVVHMDGDLKPLWKTIAESGINGIDSFSPPPDNDTSVSAAVSMWPEMRLMLNFPSSVHLCEPQIIFERAKKILSEGGHTGHLWIQISENVPPNIWKSSYPEIMKAIREFGRP